MNVVLMGMLGMTALEANLTKRWSQLTLNFVITIGALSSGLILWPVAIVGMTSTFCGSYVGGRVAVKKGDKFVVNVMVGLMFISALGLIWNTGLPAR